MEHKLVEMYNELAKMLEDAKMDMEKTCMGNKAAATRYRHALQDMVKKIKVIREAVLEAKRGE